MALTSPATPFNAHGWGLVLAELQRLRLALKGTNDLNADSMSTSQESQNLPSWMTDLSVTIVINGIPRETTLRLVEVDVCVDGSRKTMYVLGTEPR